MDRSFDETLSTTDPAQAEAIIAEAYAQNSTRYVGSTAGFFFRYDSTDLDGFGASRFNHTVGCRSDVQPIEDVVAVSRAHSGQMTFTDRRSTLSVRASSVLFDPDQEIHVILTDCVASILRFDRATVERMAAELTGYDGPRRLRFEMSKPVSEAKSRHWDALTRYVIRDVLPNRAVRDNPMISSQLMRLLVANLLDTFPGITPAEPPGGLGTSGSGVVRRALAFMTEHADSDISLADIAAAARVGPRTVQQAFRSHLSTTPTTHLRRIRLERAHDDLAAADPCNGDSVAGIAARWGFAHPGRFAARYSSRYGRPPSHTLRG